MTLSTIIMVLVPMFFYLLIIMLTTPVTSIKISTSTKYLFYGFTSIILVDFFHDIFPSFFRPILFDIEIINKEIDTIFYFCFVQIGFIEEFCKFITFILITKFLIKNEYPHPIGTMFYYGMVGLSFGTLENLHYAKLYGDQIILSRSLTSMVLHMMLGFISGYWIALVNVKTTMGRSLLEIFIHNNRFFKILFYSLSAIFVPTIIHGIYNFNLFTSGESSWSIMFTQLLLTIFITYIAAKNLMNKYKKSFKNIM